MEISNIKSYKLNKTFENSIYPLEQELKEINNNTVSNALNNLVAIIFSGIGTSILLDENSALILLGELYDAIGIPIEGNERAIWNLIISIVCFLFMFIIGLVINKCIKKRNVLYKKKGTHKGRSELREAFHKSIINDIVIGLSFVDKAEELTYKGDVSEMYLFEAAYYFVQAKIQMEEMELLSPEKSSTQKKFVEQIGLKTIESTCKVYNAGLIKLVNAMPNGKEKEQIKKIIESIQPYLPVE